MPRAGCDKALGKRRALCGESGEGPAAVCGRAFPLWGVSRAFLVGSVVAAATFGACGGDADGDGELAAERIATFEPAIESAVQLVEQIGDPDEAFDAVLFAFERGYAGSQYVEAIEGDALRPDGVITSGGSVVLDPDGEPLGLVTLPEETSMRPGSFLYVSALPVTLPPRSVSGQSASVDPSSIREANVIDTEIWDQLSSDRRQTERDFYKAPNLHETTQQIAFINLMVLSGYSSRQITEVLTDAVVTGEKVSFGMLNSEIDGDITTTYFTSPATTWITQRFLNSVFCTGLRDSSGRFLLPDFPPLDGSVLSDEVDAGITCHELFVLHNESNPPAQAGATDPPETPHVPPSGGTSGGGTTATSNQADQTATSAPSITVVVTASATPTGTLVTTATPVSGSTPVPTATADISWIDGAVAEVVAALVAAGYSQAEAQQLAQPVRQCLIVEAASGASEAEARAACADHFDPPDAEPSATIAPTPTMTPAPSGSDCPGVSEAACAHSGTHVYNQVTSFPECSIANTVSGNLPPHTFVFADGQVTLSFSGASYVYYAVGPDKFQAGNVVVEFVSANQYNLYNVTNCIFYQRFRVN